MSNSRTNKAQGIYISDTFGREQTSTRNEQPKRWIFLSLSSDGERLAVRQLATMGDTPPLSPSKWDSLPIANRKAAIRLLESIVDLIGAPGNGGPKDE